MKPIDRNAPQSPRRPRPPARFTRSAARPGETYIELMTRDLEAWRLAKGVITKASLRD